MYTIDFGDHQRFEYEGTEVSHFEIAVIFLAHSHADEL